MRILHANHELVSAVENDSLENVRNALKHGANPNLTMNGIPVLVHASALGYPETVKILVNNHANINVISDLNWTPLIAAAANRHLDVVRYLIKRGADVSIETEEHRSAASYVAEQAENLTDEAGQILMDILRRGNTPSMLPLSTQARTILTEAAQTIFLDELFAQKPIAPLFQAMTRAYLFGPE